MSLKTWLKEFYPRSAEMAAKRSKRAALEHSIQKWQGLLKTNLKRHGLNKNYRDIYDSEHRFIVDGITCALCLKYYEEDSQPCDRCPLYQALGQRCDLGDTAPYRKFVFSNDARPMLRALRKAERLLNTRSQSR